MIKWTIYSKDNCPYCDKAKFELQHEAEVEVKNISTNPDYLTELMEKNPVARTMPQIFKDDKLIGGYDQLIADRAIDAKYGI
jgi:glutaredoxin